jgi:hypothetical protein
LTSSLAATLLVSLRRTRAAWPIALAAGLTCLLASSLLAAGPMYASAVSTAGLHRVLADAPPAEANVGISMWVEPDRLDEVDRTVIAELDGVLQGIGGPVVRLARSQSFDLPLDRPGDRTDLVELAYAEGLQNRASLVDGAWPRDAGEDAVPVAVGEHVAGPLGLGVGDLLSLTSRLRPDVVVPVRIVGIFRIDDPAAAYWWDDPQVLDGLVTSTNFATHGPFFTTRRALFDRATVGTSRAEWRAFPDPARVSVEEMGALRARVEALDGRLERATDGITVTVETGLPAILAAADRSLLVSRTGVLLLIVQLAVLAAYAVLLSAALLVDHRRMDTAMLRSRGAGPWRIATMTLAEGLLITGPAFLLGPWVALAALGLFNVVGPLTAIGLRIDPSVSMDAYVASAAAALGCLVALVLPALPTRRSFAAVKGGLSRADTRPAGQRLGLDVALVAIAAIGVWQLRHYGAPLTRSVQGAVGIDPLLVATPAIGLLAGALVALRLLPLLAGAIERVTARGRGLVSSLGARQLARRPLRYTRAALLLMLAMAMGVFAVSYTWTWTASQRDQAGYQAGADIRVQPGTRSDAPPRWALDHAYAAVPGIAARMPVDRSSVQASRSATGELIALDAAAAPAMVNLRPDISPTTMSDLMAPLAAARPNVPATRLPDGTRRLRLDLRSEVEHLERSVFDPDDGTETTVAADPAVAAQQPYLSARVVVRDGTGQLYRFSGGSTTIGDRVALVVELGRTEAGGTTATGLAFVAPLELLAVELAVTMPADLRITKGAFAVEGVDASPDGDAWSQVPLALPGGWRTTSSVYGLPHVRVEMPPAGAGSLRAAVLEPGLGELRGVDRYGRGTILTFAPANLDVLGREPVPAIASAPFLEASGRQVGETMSVEISGVRRPVAIVGEVRAFPTVDPDVPVLVMDLPTLALLRFAGSDTVASATEWWFAVDEGQRDAVVGRLEERPIASRSVLTALDRERALATDPVALGIIGALAIGFVAAALFAVVGFIVSAAVSARERVAEFALLRALGLSSVQLSSWLSLENAVLAAVSLAAGTALGLLMAWLMLPFVTVTQGGATPYPPVTVAVPWASIMILEVVAIVTLATTVIVLAWLLRRIGLAAVLRTGEE